MNYYPFHVGDYASHTAHLDPIEDLAYRRMLDAYYLRESELPHDPAEVARVIRLRQYVAEVEVVLREFFSLTENGWAHGRCQREIETMRDKQQKQRAKANKRWHKPDASHSNADAMPPTPTPTPTPTPIKDTPIPPTQAQVALPAKKTAVSLSTWLASIRSIGEQPIPESDPVFDYAEQAGIPIEMLRLCWVEFKARYSEDNAKRYKDWRSVYRKAVRGNWLRLWRVDDSGAYALTTEGRQAKLALESRETA